MIIFNLSKLATDKLCPIKFHATVIDIIARIFRLQDLNEDNLARFEHLQLGLQRKQQEEFPTTTARSSNP